eukprot:s2221_g10.t1
MGVTKKDIQHYINYLQRDAGILRGANGAWNNALQQRLYTWLLKEKKGSKTKAIKDKTAENKGTDNHIKAIMDKNPDIDDKQKGEDMDKDAADKKRNQKDVDMDSDIADNNHNGNQKNTDVGKDIADKNQEDKDMDNDIADKSQENKDKRRILISMLRTIVHCRTRWHEERRA